MSVLMLASTKLEPSFFFGKPSGPGKNARRRHTRTHTRTGDVGVGNRRNGTRAERKRERERKVTKTFRDRYVSHDSTIARV